MKMTYKVEGLKELDAALVELGNRASAKRIGRKVLIAVANPVADTMRALVPVKTGRLKRSIQVSARLTRNQKKKHKKIVTKAGVEVFVGAAEWTSHLVEFGTVRSRPKPFARPAWEAHKGLVLPRLAAELRKEIDAAAKRAAARALKAKK